MGALTLILPILLATTAVAIGEATQCEDQSEKCKRWANSGYCEQPKYKSYMEEKCPNSCMLCDDSACADVKPLTCEKWTKKGFCTKGKYAMYMRKNCKKSCNMCGDKKNKTTPKPIPTTSRPVSTTTVTTTTPTTPEQTTPAMVELTTAYKKYTTEVEEVITQADEITTVVDWNTTQSIYYTTVPEVLSTEAEYEELFTTMPVQTTEAQTTSPSTAPTFAPPQTTPQQTTVRNDIKTSEAATATAIKSSEETTVGIEGCSDDLSTCHYIAGYCNSSSFIRNSCQKTCGLCKNKTPTTSATTASQTTDSITPTSLSYTTAAKQNVVTSAAQTQATMTARPEIPVTTGGANNATTTTHVQDTQNTTAASVTPVTTTTKQITTIASTQITPCMDTLAVCTQYNKSACALSESLKEFCPVLCGICVPTPEETTTSATTASPTTTAPATTAPTSNPYSIKNTTVAPQLAGKCEDEAPTCAQYVMHCSLADMKRKCPVTCGMCKSVNDYKFKTPVQCEDLDPNVCNILKSYCTGATLSEKIQKQCPKSCNVCNQPAIYPTPILETTTQASEVTTTAPPLVACFDEFDNCQKLVNFCTSIPQMKDTCSKTCGTCPKVSVLTNQTASETNETASFECVDTFAYCHEISHKCNEPGSMSYLKLTCKKTCGFCDEDIQETKIKWSQWSDCSATCGEGEQKRTQLCEAEGKCNENMITQFRTCKVAECQAGVIGQQGCKDIINIERCTKYKNTAQCQTPQISYLCQQTCGICKPTQTKIAATQTTFYSIQGEYSQWEPWSECSASCGTGMQERRRDCMQPSQRADSVMCEGASREQRNCSVAGCEVEEVNQVCEDLNDDCTAWAANGFCFKTYVEYMSTNCPVSCNTCGLWGQWSDWNDCSKTCGGGFQTRYRNCVSTSCDGDRMERRACNEQVCGEPVCRDISDACTRLPELNKCGDPKWKLLCRQSCGQCGNPIGSIDKESSACSDQLSSCPLAAQQGLCSNARVAQSCSKSCGTCSLLRDSCTDKFPQCASMANAELCQQPAVANACPKTCMTCPGSVIKATDTCVDTSSSCEIYMKISSLKVCTNSKLSQGCKKSCNLCNEQKSVEIEVSDTCKDSTESCPKLVSLCETNPTLRNICKLSCGVCRKPTEMEMEKTKIQHVDSKCFDKRAEGCDVFKRSGFCKEDWIREDCMRSCGECFASDSGNIDYIDVPLINPGITDVAVAPCMDITPKCKLQSHEDCKTPYIAFVCAESCGSCLPNSKSIVSDSGCSLALDDKMDNCAAYASLCEVAAVKETCSKTCACRNADMEGKSNDHHSTCRDYMRICSKNAQLCTEDSTMNYARTMCPYTCDACDSTNQGTWQAWGTWTRCSATCNGGKRLRTRACPRGTECEGAEYQEGECNKEPCTGISNIRPSCQDQLLDCGELAKIGRCSDLVYRAEMQMKCMQTCLMYVRYDEQMVANCISQWKPWSVWTQCSATCGQGTKIRTRQCEVEGKCEGSDQEIENCETECQEWDNWQEWSECSVSCGVGKQHRVRTCRLEGECEGSSGEVRTCHQKTCGYWAMWSVWGECSATCDDGVRTRQRDCIGGEQGEGQCLGDQQERVNCSSGVLCPVWSDWSATSECSETCGGGNVTMVRECLNAPNASFCGNESTNGIFECNTQPCSTWSQWSEWANCSTSCGTGSQTRQRECEGVGECDGSSTDTISCTSTYGCGDWKSWESWSACSKTCNGEGTQSRSRLCEGNKTCNGNDSEIRTCYVYSACEYWENWSQFSECSVSCGEGIRTRKRKCVGGEDGSAGCQGKSFDEIICQQVPCTATQSEWSEWVDGECSQTCGNGTMERTRTCINGIPGHGGCVGELTMTSECITEPCVKGKWDMWSEWSTCSVSCAEGVQKRERTCIDGIAGEGGCIGDEKEATTCTEMPCPTWSLWNEWSRCSKSCNGGINTRRRSCEGGKDEECGSEATEQTAHCNRHQCPTWSNWSEWSNCSAECGEGSITRTRDCLYGSRGEDGCLGLSKHMEDCFIQSCDKEACIQQRLRLDSVEEFPNKAFIASSFLPMYAPYNARLDSDNAWCTSHTNDWIEIDLGSKRLITGVIMQGFPGADLVEEFSVKYNTSESYQKTIQNEDGIYFNGEQTETAFSRFWSPIAAQIWRINIFNTVPGIVCLQMDFIECGSYITQDDGSGDLFEFIV